MTSQSAGFGARGDPGTARSLPEGRRGLVLGAGGSLGAAWMIGALCALEDTYGWDPRTADVILGTSAGAIVGSALALGTRPCELRDHQRGNAVASGPLQGVHVDYDTWVGGGLPPLPKPGLGSLKLLRSMAGRPHRMPLTILLAAFAPPGRASLDGVHDVFCQLGMANRWPTDAALRVVAVDVDTGRRVLFGTPDAPRTDLARAVTASCALPAWFAPVEIDGRRYVDGCAWSDTNLDLLAGDGLDEVIVLAPTSARRADRPGGLAARVERRLRRVATGRLLREVRLARDAGIRARVITPGPEDLAVMGANLMDPLHRLTVLETSLRTTAAQLRTPSPEWTGTVPPPHEQGPTDRRPA